MDASSSNGTGPDKQYKSEKCEEMPYGSFFSQQTDN